MTEFDGTQRETERPQRIGWRTRLRVAALLCAIGAVGAGFAAWQQEWPLEATLGVAGTVLVFLGMVLNLPAFVFGGLNQYNAGRQQVLLQYMRDHETPGDAHMQEVLNVIFVIAGLPLLLAALGISYFG